MFEAIANTPIPTILVVAGVLFLFIAIGGQLGAKLNSAGIQKVPAALLGGVLLVSGLGLYVMRQTLPAQDAEVSAPEQDARQEGDDRLVRVSLPGFLVHEDGDLEGKGDIYWELRINDDIVSQRSLADRKEISDGETETLLNASREVDLIPGGELVLSGFIRDDDLNGADSVEFEETLPMSIGEGSLPLHGDGVRGAPYIDLLYTVELLP